jgi:hypothetical protein
LDDPPLYKLMLTNLGDIRKPIIVCTHTILNVKIVVVVGVACCIKNVGREQALRLIEHIPSQYK